MMGAMQSTRGSRIGLRALCRCNTAHSPAKRYDTAWDWDSLMIMTRMIRPRDRTAGAFGFGQFERARRTKDGSYTHENYHDKEEERGGAARYPVVVVVVPLLGNAGRRRNSI